MVAVVAGDCDAAETLAMRLGSSPPLVLFR